MRGLRPIRGRRHDAAQLPRHGGLGHDFGACDRGRNAGRAVLLYGDHEGGQRMISRFALAATPKGSWLAVVGRHWNLDRPNPR